MKFVAPFYDLQTEFYSLMSKADEIDFNVYDSGISVSEVMDDLKNQSEIRYGIIADVTGTTTSSKTDSIIWKMSIRLELFSNYNGRKEIADMISTVGAVVTGYEEPFQINLAARGFNVLDVKIGNTAIGSALTDGAIHWQNGFITIDYLISQVDNDDGIYGGIY